MQFSLERLCCVETIFCLCTVSSTRKPTSTVTPAWHATCSVSSPKPSPISMIDVDALMVMQVHDELVFEVTESQVEAFKAEVKTRMQNAATLSVALTV